MHARTPRRKILISLWIACASLACVDIPEPTLGAVEVEGNNPNNNATPANNAPTNNTGACFAAGATVWFRDQDGDT